MTINSRTTNYLIKMYSQMSEREQQKKLNEIIDRLSLLDWTNKELLNNAVSIAKSKWTMGQVIAYFDLLDIEERT